MFSFKVILATDVRRDVLLVDGVKIVVNYVTVRIIQHVILCLVSVIVNLVIMDNIVNRNATKDYMVIIVKINVFVRIMHDATGMI